MTARKFVSLIVLVDARKRKGLLAVRRSKKISMILETAVGRA
jgi:hypothetical protein